MADRGETKRPAEGVPPVGRRVAANIRTLRNARRMSTLRLAARLAELGRPIIATGITKIEANHRRVDVDDLVALALALDVSPNRLLLPGEGGSSHFQTAHGMGTTSDGSELELTSVVRVPVLDAWQWATGEMPLLWPREELRPVTRVTEERWAAFRRENRPYESSETQSRFFDKRELQRHPELLSMAIDLVTAARTAGVEPELVYDFLDFATMMSAAKAPED